MTKEKGQRLTVITNNRATTKDYDILKHQESPDYKDKSGFQTNPMYEKLLNFRNLQETQKKRFSVDDLFKLC